MITTKKIDPRPYQQKAAAAIHREWDAGNKKTLVVMPTGTGKTIVFASIVNDQVEKGEHVLILAHREELLQQASDKLKMVTGLETALEKAQNSALDSDKMVVVASVQTLSKQNRLMKYTRKQIARRGETAVYATVEEAEAWVERQKAARTRR